MEATRMRRFLQKVEGISVITRFFQKIIRNQCFLLRRSYDEEKDKRMEATRKRIGSSRRWREFPSSQDFFK
jgi:hypothetical protein